MKIDFVAISNFAACRDAAQKDEHIAAAFAVWVLHRPLAVGMLEKVRSDGGPGSLPLHIQAAVCRRTKHAQIEHG